MIKKVVNFIMWAFCYSAPVIVLVAAILKRVDIIWVTLIVFAVFAFIIGNFYRDGQGVTG